jgi:hypothetical protein
VSGTLLSESSLSPSRSSDTGTLRLMRYGRFPANCASPTGTPASETLTWWSTAWPDSEAPCRKTSISAVWVEALSTPESEKLIVRVAPEAMPSQSHGSAASSSPGW